ncbi:F0F1 ATP synthase subunit delta [Nocardioides donggukensis]|uniref:ATP synthase subunit delta n=1 Tax=Nocardioides donggukensis TaxID=2774019 RepID=A0A927K6V3_9ACTN|nr:F0F1 ATP synthase subunit delta [Nocardioides donggukensis]MBD8870098.1 F0F1 ATP synthase subunit delta [Nocardioides donggukensis]
MLLRGPSADAAATLGDRLRAAISEVGSRKAAQVGEELFGVSGVLRTNPSLRRTVTDVSVDGRARGELVRGLFDGKVDPVTLDLVVGAVEQRWTRPRDLPDTLENLGVEAVIRSADEPGRVADELFAFEQVLVENPDLRSALSDPSRSVSDKRDLLRGLLEGRTLSATARLVDQSLAGTYRTISVAMREYQKVAAGVHGESVATVRAASELSDGEQERLRSALSTQYGRDVHLNIVVDPTVIGGIRVEIGDDVIDGTVSARLADARRRLAG